MNRSPLLALVLAPTLFAHAAIAISPRQTPPLALVYRGPIVGCEGCAEAIAAVLQKSKWHFEVKFVGPGEVLPFAAAILQKASLYAQPGGDGDVARANALLEKQLGGRHVMSNWVKAGGRYYGTCMGGFLAAEPDKAYPEVSEKKWPGFGLLFGTVGEWIKSPGASVKHEKDSVVEVTWEGKSRWVYFQDGPHFNFRAAAPGQVLATYKSNGLPAVAVSPLGSGKVAVAGPHLEADQAWFAKAQVTDPGDPLGAQNHAIDLAQRLIDTVME